MCRELSVLFSRARRVHTLARANKFICILDRVLMKLEAKLVDFVGIKAEVLKGI